MSQDRLPDALFEEPPPPSDEARRLRAASVTLREQGADSDDPAALMDPAAKSLTEALQITFGLLKLAMVVLMVLFIFSGSQSVQQGERGIRVVMGVPVNSDLGPGFHWSLPYPLGELVRIPQASPAIAMDEAFWPFLTPQDRNKTSAELAGFGADNLSPERDGSLLTAEGYLAHVKCMIRYRRDEPRKSHAAIRSVDEEFKIVQAAVRRGLIHAASVLSVDEIIKGTPDPTRAPGEFRAMETIAKEVAERTLEEMDSGIRLESLSLTDRMPPAVVARDYNRPALALSESTRLIEIAQEERRNILTSAAGAAADVLLSQIDLYESQLHLGETEAAMETQARIDAILLGESVEIPGMGLAPRIDGAIPALLSGARQYRSTVVSATQSDAERFRAIRESYRTNPQVVLHREWTDALRTFLVRPSVQVQMLVPGERWVLQINRDPSVVRELERERLLGENKAREAQRQRDRELERFQRRADPNRQRTTAD